MNALSKLHELERLEIISKLEETLTHHKSVLEPLRSLDKLEHLRTLKELESLQKLSELQSLDKLKILEKLDRIEDTKFAERLERLDKIDILKQESKKLVVQQVAGAALDLFKICAVTAAIFIFLSLRIGQDFTAKVLPALGFGSSAQVNFALKILANEGSSELFQSSLADLRKRISKEINDIFSENSFLPLKRRLELVNEVLNYSYVSSGTDLHSENSKLIQVKLNEIESDILPRIEYEMSIAKAKNDSPREERLKTIKILLMQKQFAKLLEISLPLWEKENLMSQVTVLSAVKLQLNDPKTLKEITRGLL